MSHASLEEIVQTAREAGALGAKLTGAGRGGAAIILVRSGDVDHVVAALRGRAQRLWRAGLGVEGVTVDCS